MGILDSGINLLRNGQNKEAVDYFKTAAEHHPENDGVYRFLGKSYSLTGDKIKATEAIERAIEINHKQPMWLFKLLAENKLRYIYIEDAQGVIPDVVISKLSNVEKLEELLGLKDNSVLCATEGDGKFGNKIICKAIADKKSLSFLLSMVKKYVQITR